MAYINNAVEMNVKSELNLFSSTPVQTSIENGALHTYRPITSISNNGPIEFVVSGTCTDEYIDLARVYLYIRAKITVPPQAIAPGASGPPPTPVIGPVNNWIHSMFSQVDVFLNQKCVTPPTNCYPFRAYLENLLNYSGISKTSHLTASLFYADTYGHMESTGADNEGFTKRRTHTVDNKVVELYGPLHCDLFNVDKLLLSGVEMSVKLQQSKDAFHLMGAANTGATFEILDAELHVRKVKVNSNVVMAHNRALEIATAKYPINRVDVKAITIPTGSQTKTMDNLFLGSLPQRCIIGFVDTAAFNGTVTSNPFNFRCYSITHLAAFLNSSCIPSKPYICDFPNNQYIRAYSSLFEGCNFNYTDFGNGISREAYAAGYTLFAIDLTPDLSASEPHNSLPKTGTLRLEVRFNEPLTQSVTAVIFAEFPSTIEIDKNRNVITDYNS